MKATYRIQCENCTFKKLSAIMPYLAELGVSHVYASPIFRSASPHGYDVIDPASINPRLGTLKELRSLAKNRHGIRWIQDIVPNHMAFHSSNPEIAEVMREGKVKNTLLDIDWNHPSLKGKLLTPFLGSTLHHAIQKNEIHLDFDGEFILRYYEHRYPLSYVSYPAILSLLKKHAPHVLPSGVAATMSPAKLRKQMASIKDGATREVSRALRGIRNKKDIQDLLKKQYFELAYWKTAMRRINYRRFFDINDLICTRIQDKAAHERYHHLIDTLLDEGVFDGVRIDHIDGMHDPALYLSRFKKRHPGARVFMEKIISKDESLPGWAPPTTGYESINMIEGVLTSNEGDKPLHKAFASFTGERRSFDKVLRTSKKDILSLFRGDIDNLVRRIAPYTSHYARGDLRAAVSEILVSFDRYRSYVSPRSNAGMSVITKAIQKARKYRPSLDGVLCAIEWVLASNEGHDAIMQLQQLTGPVMAKGLEDTALYRYIRLLGRNEVGCHDFTVSRDTFHAFAKNNESLIAGSTHDTKRGEDARARLLALSEMPSRWETVVSGWRRMNRPHRRTIEGRTAPSPTHEYYIYQAMLASFPFQRREQDRFKKRLQEHARKAMRESKHITSWHAPHERYEEAVMSFIARLFQDTQFMEDFTQFWKDIAQYGVLNSLSALIMRHTIPGVPDIYQGCELFNFAMTDPDNRGAVDFEHRRYMLSQVHRGCDPQNLLQKHQDGRIKMHIIRSLLASRQKFPRLFREGTYHAMHPEGTNREHIIAYRRSVDTHHMIVIAPRFFSGITSPPKMPDTRYLKDTRLTIPAGSYRNVLTKEKFSLEGSVSCHDILGTFPYAVLVKT